MVDHYIVPSVALELLNGGFVFVLLVMSYFLHGAKTHIVVGLVRTPDEQVLSMMAVKRTIKRKEIENSVRFFEVFAVINANVVAMLIRQSYMFITSNQEAKVVQMN